MSRHVFVASFPHTHKTGPQRDPERHEIQLDTKEGEAVVIPFDRWEELGKPQNVTVVVDVGDTADEHRKAAGMPTEATERIVDVAVVKRGGKGKGKKDDQFVVTLQSSTGEVIFTSELFKNHTHAVKVAQDTGYAVHDETGIPEEPGRKATHEARMTMMEPADEPAAGDEKVED